jgi:hypothetical protein
MDRKWEWIFGGQVRLTNICATLLRNRRDRGNRPEEGAGAA